jgi:hypothetical protein
MLISLILGLGIAVAAPRENDIYLETGLLDVEDEQWGMLSFDSAIQTTGVSVGLGLRPWLQVAAGYHRSVEASILEMDGDSSEPLSAGMALVSNQLTVGPRALWRPRPWGALYGSAQFLGSHGRLVVDEDLEEEDNLNQFTDHDFAPGAALTAGMELSPVKIKNRARVATHLEMGYALVGAMDFEAPSGKDGAEPLSMGGPDFGGFFLRAGVGLRF